MAMPNGSTWDPDNGYTNYYDTWFGGGGGSMQAVYGGGISFSGSLGGFTKVDLPGKQRYGWIWQPGDFQIHLPEITGWEWVSDPIGLDDDYMDFLFGFDDPPKNDGRGGDGNSSYVVQPGDNLFHIANRRFNRAFTWEQLFLANPGLEYTYTEDGILNPIIHPAMILKIPDPSLHHSLRTHTYVEWQHMNDNIAHARHWYRQGYQRKPLAGLRLSITIGASKFTNRYGVTLDNMYPAHSSQTGFVMGKYHRKINIPPLFKLE